MFIQPNLEDEIIKTEKKLAELTAEFERLNLMIDKHFEETSISEEALQQFFSKKEHFSESVWIKLQEERQKLDDKLKKTETQSQSASAIQKRRSEMNVASHWLFVR